MKNSMLKRKIAFVAVPACAAFLLGGMVTSCSDDLLTGQPSWLGESVYAELERRGNFTETLKLINAQDEDYASVLKKTGSKTLFVADDDAWKAFYQNNPWGITSLETMTKAQKKLLFKANMINSAYLVELLGNLPSANANEDPKEGACMRRANSVDIMDSVPVVTKDKIPVVNPIRISTETGKQIDYWEHVRGKDSIPMLMDNNVASMIHFMPKFMQNSNVTSEDVAFLTNGEISTNEGAFVNGKVITERDITCQNGYIHVLEGVALPLDNMANVIANQPQFSIFNRLLDRFSYPHYDPTITREYQRQYGGEDSVFVKRYFNSHSGNAFTHTDNNVDVNELLDYDPGWNLYRVNSTNVTYQSDAAVMLVPTDQAMLDYLEGNGADLKSRYGNAGPGETAWDNAPDNVILPQVMNAMLPSLKAAIPSQFGSINNTASENMGVKKEDIDQVLWACNGVVYQVNKVYVAPEYVSVYYPCVVRGNTDMYITYSTIQLDKRTQGGLGMHAYLNNMGSKYSFIIPTDNAMQFYYDPVSYKRKTATGADNAVAYKFKYEQSLLKADAYLVDWTDLDEYGRGKIADQASTNIKISTDFNINGDALNHFSDIFNSSLAVGLFTPGQEFYEARNGGPIVVQWEGSNVKGVAGSFQYERGYFIPVLESVDKSEDGNGRSYVIDEEPMMSTFTSPYAALTDTLRQDHFGTFAKLMAGMDMVVNNDGANHTTMDYALKALNNYHYTIYVPTNASIDALIAEGKMPTWDDVDDVTEAWKQASVKYYEISDKYKDTEEQPTEAEVAEMEKIAADSLFLFNQITRMKEIINNFVNYHIQDNSVYVKGRNCNRQNDVFESSCLDTLSNRFVKIAVDYELGGTMKVYDNVGLEHHVDNDYCNILTRQYYFNGKDLRGTNSTRIYSSSFAVLHQIDTPLQPSADCYYSPADYQKVKQLIDLYPVENEEPTPTPNPIKRKR